MTLRVERACGIRFVLKEGSASIPWDWSKHRVRIQQKDGPGEEIGSASSGKEYRALVSQPGTYSVNFESISGYNPVPAQDVEVKPREFADVTITLVPTK